MLRFSIHFFFSSFINSASRASSSFYDGSEYAGSPSCCDSGYCGGGRGKGRGGREYLFLFDLSPLLQTWFCYWKMVMRRCMAETFRSLCCGKSQFVLWKDCSCVAEGFFLCQAMIFLVLRKDSSCVAEGLFLCDERIFIVARKDPSWVWDGFFLCRARIPLVWRMDSSCVVEGVKNEPRLMVQHSGLGRTLALNTLGFYHHQSRMHAFQLNNKALVGLNSCLRICLRFKYWMVFYERPKCLYAAVTNLPQRQGWYVPQLQNSSCHNFHHPHVH